MNPDTIVGTIYMVWEEKFGDLILRGFNLTEVLRETVYDNVLFEHFLYRKIKEISKNS